MSGGHGKPLARALCAALDPFDGLLVAEIFGETPWASVTFAGARHQIRLYLIGAGAVAVADAFAAALPELEVQVPGQIVADVRLLVEEVDENGFFAALDLEALTIDDC